PVAPRGPEPHAPRGHHLRAHLLGAGALRGGAVVAGHRAGRELGPDDRPGPRRAVARPGGVVEPRRGVGGAVHAAPGGGPGRRRGPRRARPAHAAGTGVSGAPAVPAAPSADAPVLEAEGLVTTFPIGGGRRVAVVDGV